MAELQRCNLCGKEFSQMDVYADFSDKRLLGYGTRFDGMRLDLHLCCACMEKLIENCAISPVYEEVDA